MVEFEFFLGGLMIISALTSLTTEAIKKIISEYNIKVHPNSLAAVVSTILSVAIGCGYVVYNGGSFTAQVVVYLVALVFLSWLCATVGYDKVHDTFKKRNGGSDDV